MNEVLRLFLDKNFVSRLIEGYYVECIRKIFDANNNWLTNCTKNNLTKVFQSSSYI